ncbi:FkbM family methyltransferase [Actinopolymorpha pittospori]
MFLAGASADYAAGDNELPVQQAVHDLLSPGDVFYDVGANIGFFALFAARKVGPAGAVYAFEAVPAHAASIKRNAALNGLDQLTVVEAGVCDVDGTGELLLAAHPGGASLAVGSTPPDLRGRLPVTTVRLDTLVTNGRIRPPSVVKIDVEGAELAVLDGMSDLLAAHLPALVCELDGSDETTVAAAVEAFRARLAGLSYTVTALAPSYEASGWHVVHLVATHR